jgi:hypothetical protein
MIYTILDEMIRSRFLSKNQKNIMLFLKKRLMEKEKKTQKNV